MLYGTEIVLITEQEWEEVSADHRKDENQIWSRMKELIPIVTCGDNCERFEIYRANQQ
jgi:hypothetical protein